MTNLITPLKKKILFAFLLIAIFTIFEAGCAADIFLRGKSVPHEERWGIYIVDLATEDVTLVYTCPRKISGLQLNSTGDTLVFSQKIDGNDNEHEEICTITVDGSNFRRLTNNTVLDTYPCWSPDNSKIVFLSWRDTTMDIYTMNADGSDVKKLYDSGGHDGDVHWLNDAIVFTRDSQIWIMDDDGTNARQVTNPPRVGEWGNAVLPFGDYDPKLSPDGTTIVFERMVDDKTRHGNYNIYTIREDGSQETALTDTGYTQGIANWSHSGDKLVYFVTAMGEEGVFDIYVMNADGTDNRNSTPGYFPKNFLCHSPIFSLDDSKIYFAGEWWEEASGFGVFLVLLGLFLALSVKKLT